MEYASRMKAGTRNIHYLCAPNRHLAEHSPYYEAMKQKDMEVRKPGFKPGVPSLMGNMEKSGSLPFFYACKKSVNFLNSIKV